ncbi:MAG: ROK family protein [Negativicutes bacterium]|jgi:predicted NBD/HSP70 family sugar kinase
MRLFAAIDIGGTDIKYGVVDSSGKIVFHAKISTQAQLGGEALMNRVVKLIEQLQSEHMISGIGVSSAGVIDADAGIVLLANNNLPGWQGMQIKHRLQENFALPVAVENDVNCIALGENWLGAGIDLQTFVCVALGTGVGGGIILNNKIYRGHHYRAGEVGCLRTKSGIVDYLEKNAATSVLVKNISKKEGKPDINGEYIFSQVRAENPEYISALSDWSLEVAAGLADIIYLLDPQAIVIGGGVSGSPDVLLPALSGALTQYLRSGFGCDLRVTKLGNDAGMLGAVYPLV